MLAPGSVSVKAAKRNPGMANAIGAMAKVGRPMVAMVKAAIGTPIVNPANILLLVSMGNSLTILRALVNKSLLST